MVSVLYIPFDEVYQLAADMGGAGYLFTGDNDANVMHNSALVNLNIIQQALKVGAKKLFYSSACIYPAYNQEDPQNPKCSEDSAYPAMPDSEYGWENYSANVCSRHLTATTIWTCASPVSTIFLDQKALSPAGRKKSPAAICRKVAEAQDGDGIEVWGDGQQTRSYLYTRLQQPLLRSAASSPSRPPRELAVLVGQNVRTREPARTRPSKPSGSSSTVSWKS